VSQQTSVSEGQLEPQRYSSRPAYLRNARPWHRFAFILRKMGERFEVLSKDLRVPAGGRVLDYGCADAPYRGLFSDDVDYVGADLPGNPVATAEIRPDGTVAVEDASFDAVISTQVLEHVVDPSTYLSECARVLRPGGRMLLSTHGVMIYHPDPVDLWRWTGDGLERIVTEAGFEVERLEGIQSLGASGLQLLQDAVMWRLPGFLRSPFTLVMQKLIALADRLASDEARRMNALVFAVVARKR
jgi:SAM-dependent methyltransferase